MARGRLERALDVYAAAGTVLDGARDLADLAGVVALVEEGTAPVRAAVNTSPSARGAPPTSMPAAPPQPLTVRHEGRLVPYYEVPPERSLWAATGHGSLTDGPLAPLVNRGDFRRTR